MSEVMLQQTQATRVAPAYRRFLARFPTVEALAGASRSEVLRAWAGLGYNRRAVALSEAARRIVAAHGGRVPRDPAVLRSLPGIGPYTAAAIAAFAFGSRVPPVDVNVQRVVARARLGREPHEVPAGQATAEAEVWLGGTRAAERTQAVMDLGREICRPLPRCERCPLSARCAFRASGRTPRRGPRTGSPFQGSTRQVRGAVVAVLRDRQSATLGALATASGHPLAALARAVGSLTADGLVVAGPAALRGSPRGVVRLREG